MLAVCTLSDHTCILDRQGMRRTLFAFERDDTIPVTRQLTLVS